ncbi:MAG: hypothetical protein HDT38_07215 [Clostridiales bacterium]|nr:hypothetical protein [Clostridiales bacterium]
MDRYRKMFDQAVEQLGPGQDKVDALRGSLARRCPNGQGKEAVPMKKRAGFLRVAVAVAAVVLLLSATAAAVALGERRQVAKIWESDETGVFLLDGRYYFKPDEDGETIDITGRFSDTVPYVYDAAPPDESGRRVEYVIGSVGDDVHCVTACFGAGEAYPNGFQLAWSAGTSHLEEGCPVWWRTYCYAFEEKAEAWHMWDQRDMFNAATRDVTFNWVLDDLTVDGQTGAAALTVKGETMDITRELEDGGLYVLPVDGDELIVVDDDPSLLPDHEPPYHMDDPEELAMVLAYEESLVYAPCGHEVLVCRDGDQLRWAEFVYRPDGTLRYWMPFNCPSSAELGWVEEYAGRHGYEMDWLVANAFEQPAREFQQRYRLK